MIPFVPCHERPRSKLSKMIQKFARAIVFEKSRSHYEVSLTLFTDEAPEIQIGFLSQHFHATKKKTAAFADLALSIEGICSLSTLVVIFSR